MAEVVAPPLEEGDVIAAGSSTSTFDPSESCNKAALTSLPFIFVVVICNELWRTAGYRNIQSCDGVDILIPQYKSLSTYHMLKVSASMIGICSGRLSVEAGGTYWRAESPGAGQAASKQQEALLLEA